MAGPPYAVAPRRRNARNRLGRERSDVWWFLFIPVSLCSFDRRAAARLARHRGSVVTTRVGAFAHNLPDFDGLGNVLQREGAKGAAAELAAHAASRLRAQQDLPLDGAIPQTRSEVCDRTAGREGPPFTRRALKAGRSCKALPGTDPDVHADWGMGLPSLAVGDNHFLTDGQGCPDGRSRVLLWPSCLEKDHQAIAGGLVDVSPFCPDGSQEEREVALDESIELFAG